MNLIDIQSNDLHNESDLNLVFSEICSKVSENDFLAFYNTRPSHISKENGFDHVINKIAMAGIKSSDGDVFNALTKKLEERYGKCKHEMV